MKRTAPDRTKNDLRPKPVERIALDEKPRRVHVFVFLGFLILGLVSIFLGVRACVTKTPGWDTVTPSSYADSCAGDFTLQYCFGEDGRNATDESRTLTALYTTLSTSAYRLFHERLTFDGVTNLAYIGAHPGEVLTVDPALYGALERVTSGGNRYLFYAPIFALYGGLFSCDDHDDVFAAECDPYQNPALMALIDEALTFVSDPSAISLELLDSSRVRLSVSDAYAAFLGEHEGLPTLDLFRMKNAVIIDYLADSLIARGYPYGVISSPDGFIRNMFPVGEDPLAFNIVDADSDGVRVAATYNGATYRAMIQLRSYNRGEGDPYAYSYANGLTRSASISLADGRLYAAARFVEAVSTTLDCTELILRLYPLYTAPSISDEVLLSLVSDGIYTVCARGTERVLRVAGTSIKLEKLYQLGEIVYTQETLEP